MSATSCRTVSGAYPAKCPSGVYVKRDFPLYENLSGKMLEVVKGSSPDSSNRTKASAGSITVSNNSANPTDQPARLARASHP
jgi:hypothetical protein